MDFSRQVSHERLKSHEEKENKTTCPKDISLTLLQEYARRYPEEADCIERFRAFIESYSTCFQRTLEIGHITGSAWILNKAGSHVLLTHHRKLNRWLQLGGHADGNSDVLAVALREAQEESGITTLRPLFPEIFDLDIHRIPARRHEPAHDHYDVRFLLHSAETDDFVVSDESHALAWVSTETLSETTHDESLLRMRQKWENWQKRLWG